MEDFCYLFFIDLCTELVLLIDCKVKGGFVFTVNLAAIKIVLIRLKY